MMLAKCLIDNLCVDSGDDGDGSDGGGCRVMCIDECRKMGGGDAP